jgi:AcrR family transcriptional regulator
MPAARTSEETSRLRVDLIGHARKIVRRDGAAALTMRALAREADCSVGLPYKVFADREEIVLAVAALELEELVDAFSAWLDDSAHHSVATNLDRYAAILLDSPTPALVHVEKLDGSDIRPRLQAAVRDSDFLGSLGRSVTDYIRLEHERGRISTSVDAQAFGFLITGAVHNLVVAGPGYPGPSRRELTVLLRRIARTMAA